jgi:hypothetical protein
MERSIIGHSDYAPNEADGNGPNNLSLDEAVQTFDVQPGARSSERV